MLQPRILPGDHPDAVRLAHAMFAEIAGLYGDAHGPGPSASPADFSPPGGCFVVLYEDEAPVAGGGIKRLDAATGEIKRMYVVPDARGQGVSRQLLHALEGAARELGYARVRLDTGVHQHAALHLYASAGYSEIPDYNANPYASYWGEKTL